MAYYDKMTLSTNIFLLFIRKGIGLFAHVITSVNLLCLPYAPVVIMVINVSSPALVTNCMVNNVVTSVHAVLMVSVHQSMDHVTAIQDILDQLAIEVCLDC